LLALPYHHNLPEVQHMIGSTIHPLFRGFIYSFFFLVNIIMLYPFWHAFVGSLITLEEYYRYNLLLFPHEPTLAAYKEIIELGKIFNPLKVTTIITIIGTFMSLFVTTYTAYGLSKPIVGSKVIMTFIVLTMFVNGGLIPQYLLLKELHLINSLGVYIFPALINTFFLIIMRTQFIGFSRDIIESAKVDGCGEFGIFFKLVLPLSKPILATIGLFYAVAFWNTFFASLVFVTDVSKKTLYEYVYKIVSASEGSQFATSLSFSETTKFANITIAVLPIMLVYPFLQKYFLSGVMLGAVKE
jgi:putative aldouronate transport system permease protein